MNRRCQIVRLVCIALAAGVTGALGACGGKSRAVKDQASQPAPAPVADAAPVPAPEPAKETRMAEAPDGTKMEVVSTEQRAGGLVVEDLKIGGGREVTSNSTIVIHYHGTLTDGKVFDSTRGKKAVAFPLANLIRGWQEGIPGMKVGGIRRLTIPAALGYGQNGVRAAGIPPNATLEFSIQLIDVQDQSPTAGAER